MIAAIVSGALLQAGRTPFYSRTRCHSSEDLSEFHHRGEMKQEPGIETVEEFKLCIAADHRWQA